MTSPDETATLSLSFKSTEDEMERDSDVSLNLSLKVSPTALPPPHRLQLQQLLIMEEILSSALVEFQTDQTELLEDKRQKSMSIHGRLDLCLPQAPDLGVEEPSSLTDTS